MPESIYFPSASKQSKLSACPTTKLPQSRDWIYQDIFNTLLHTSDYQKLSPHVDLFPSNKDRMSYQVSQTFSEALDIVANEPCYPSGWVNHQDYQLCPTSMLETTSAYDRTSLPDLDSTMSGEDDEEEEEDDEDEQEASLAGATFDMSQLDVAPVLIESCISSCTTSTEDVMSFRCHTTGTMAVSTLKKRKSTSSFRSLKSFISAFGSNKKQKIIHSTSTAKKFFQFFKR
ncbi:hypothetical protein MFLAVUS_010361 [Mucor flavus]|uniref:Uncharacterized protein n=1 Tax=Mucor flavus TaxID=439312 RepID=A0ABP9ZCK4_9FUNG